MLFFLQAGLVSPEAPEQLLIALEPEAASIYCRKLRLHQVVDLSTRPMANGIDSDGPRLSSFRQGERSHFLSKPLAPRTWVTRLAQFKQIVSYS